MGILRQKIIIQIIHIMKLIASVTALAGIAAAQYYEPHIPLDCYNKIE